MRATRVNRCLRDRIILFLGSREHSSALMARQLLACPRRAVNSPGPKGRAGRREGLTEGFFGWDYSLPGFTRAHFCIDGTAAPCLSAPSGQLPRPEGSRRKARGVDGGVFWMGLFSSWVHASTFLH